jgi:RNA polymerase sigma-70 factor, ECF subfamily
LSDSELVRLALAGSEDAFRMLVSRHQRRVYNLLARMLRNPALAEDLAQETFLKAYAKLRTFNPTFKFSNWILRIAHNSAIDSLRRLGPQEVPIDEITEAGQARLDDVLIDRSSDEAVSRLERRDLARALDAAMARLRPEYRKVVALRYQEDLSYEEIAAITGDPIGTVKSNLHRARAQMAEFLSGSGLLQPDAPPSRRNQQEPPA